MASTLDIYSRPIELFLSLFDSVPQHLKVESMVPGAANDPLNAIGARGGLCWWAPAEAGGRDLVCQAFGVVMPAIVFVVSLSVIVATTLILWRFWKKSRAFKATLDQLLGELSQTNPSADPKSEWEALLSILERGEFRSAPIDSLIRDLQASRIEISSGKGQFALKKEWKEIAERGQTVESWTGKNLVDQLPTWLTSLGLLTTFIAILLGLQQIHVLPNLEVQGIGGLVNGLSGKFFSSIVALACALIASIVNYRWSSLVFASWEKVIHSVGKRVPEVSLEALLYQIMSERNSR